MEVIFVSILNLLLLLGKIAYPVTIITYSLVNGLEGLESEYYSTVLVYVELLYRVDIFFVRRVEACFVL